MNNILKHTFLLFALILSVSSFAQNADKILDKTSATLKAAGNVKIGYTLKAEGESSVGYIKIQGQKFVINMGGSITWFDGKNMWLYVKENEEVNVTTPSASQVAKMNPYAFLTFYKKGYKAKMGKSTSTDYEVILTGNEGSAYSEVILRTNKKTYVPSSIKMTSAKGFVTEIDCNSFLPNQKYDASTFKFNKSKFPNAEIIDLR